MTLMQNIQVPLSCISFAQPSSSFPLPSCCTINSQQTFLLVLSSLWQIFLLQSLQLRTDKGLLLCHITLLPGQFQFSCTSSSFIKVYQKLPYKAAWKSSVVHVQSWEKENRAATIFKNGVYVQFLLRLLSGMCHFLSSQLPKTQKCEFSFKCGVNQPFLSKSKQIKFIPKGWQGQSCLTFVSLCFTRFSSAVPDSFAHQHLNTSRPTRQGIQHTT